MSSPQAPQAFSIRSFSLKARFLPAGLLAAAWLVAAPDAFAQATLTAGDAADAFTSTVLADGLSQPTDMAELPDGRVVVTQRLGDVAVVNTNGDIVEAGHITVSPDFQEQGLLGVIADPDFATNNLLYFYASVEPSDVKNKHKVYKIKLGADGKLDAARDTVISMGLRASSMSSDGGFGNHNGGGLIIHKGQLYVAVGDSGHNATPPTNRFGTCLNVTNGKILRVNLDGSVPADNPLSNESMVTGCTDWNKDLAMQPPEKRIFAWGFRNPYRFWIDPHTDRLWIGDVGETTKEEIAIGAPISGDGGKGQHFGWPFWEGTRHYTPDGTDKQTFQPANSCMGVMPARECIPAVYDYGHDGGNNCVIGGLIPEGCGWAAPWTSRYFFGDNGSGRIWTIDVNANRDGVVSGSVKDFAKSGGIGSFRMGAKGVMYLAEVSGGKVTKITPKGLDPTMCTSSTGGAGGMGSGGATAGGTAGMTSSGGAPTTGGTGTGATSGSGTSGTTSGGTGATTGGRPGTGGTTGGATPTTGGTGATGGTTGGTGATGGTNTGATGGTTAAGGAGGAPTGGAGKPAGGSGGKEDSGCGCRVADGGSSAGGLLALVGVLGLFGRRRRSRRH
jgi:MYXO-CTERM domain-containing protein